MIIPDIPYLSLKSLGNLTPDSISEEDRIVVDRVIHEAMKALQTQPYAFLCSILTDIEISDLFVGTSNERHKLAVRDRFCSELRVIISDAVYPNQTMGGWARHQTQHYGVPHRDGRTVRLAVLNYLDGLYSYKGSNMSLAKAKAAYANWKVENTVSQDTLNEIVELVMGAAIREAGEGKQVLRDHLDLFVPRYISNMQNKSVRNEMMNIIQAHVERSMKDAGFQCEMTSDRGSLEVVVSGWVN